MHTNSTHLFERAKKVIPGGIYGHVSPSASLPDCFPFYCQSASGYNFIDVDGNQWIDFMCGFGAILHGFNNQEIEEAAFKQRSLGAVFNQPSGVMVDLAEAMVDLIDFSNWVVFAKNGSDLTTWAIRVARETTKRSLIIKAKGAYHGVDAWCDPGFGGRIATDREAILEFEWNQIDQLASLFKRHSQKIAGVILTPYHHPAFAKSEMPIPEFWSEVESLCRKDGTLLILDDVRSGFRLHEGGSHRFFNFTPDLAVYSKALGSGYAISACAGKKDLKKAASEVFLTGSCWNDAVAMSAALTSIMISKRDFVAHEVIKKGDYFCRKLTQEAQNLGFPLQMTGPPSMPYPYVEGDENLFQIQKFCRYCAAEKLFFHPHHNWFISNSHTQNSLDFALEKAVVALNKMLAETN